MNIRKHQPSGMVYWGSYFIIKLFSKIFFPFTTEGRKHIPSQGSYIFASNHLSYLDPLIIGLSVWRRISYMAKKSLFTNPLLGWFLRQVGTFPIRRGEPDIAALREALRRLKNGSPLLLFPQGTRLETGGVKAQPGVGFLVAKSQVPIIPVFIQGSDHVLPPGARWFKRHPIRVRFGPPVFIPPGQSYEQIADQVMGAIGALSSC
ncbi:MAG TPA: lysophospholipid acyltransferase family protein [Candidatus Omnitrophota bacterium]|nr:1-acyl-sn-glycerol-3-phosphate acyltransferase [Candidatus Omnitrophota bacterium]HQO57451.1 lysophospholipid acyltransferase family protein [Candidatus Omnitrophota bacterium]